ncbi:MAG: type II toxin-antitoxin system VapC family toxin [Gaiellaceae bacterium]
MSSAVLDASAFLAYLRDEPGADDVADAIADGAAISTANLAEVLSRAADRGADPQRLTRQLTERGLLDGAIAVEPLLAADTVEIARLRPLTREHGLSLGDRACLALAKRLELPAVTADTAWSRLDLRVEVRRIR